MKAISLVVPVYNEQDNIMHFYTSVQQVMETLAGRYTWELIFVDDGSSDASRALLQTLADRDRHVQPVLLARNYGHQLALTCGLDRAFGDVVITLDGDMQHPPTMIPELLSYYEQGYDVVQTIRETTQGVSLVKKVTSAFYYRALNAISDVEVRPGGSDFRLLSRPAADALRRFREHDRFIRGMVTQLGFRQVTVPFVAPARYAGRSKFSPRKMLRLALAGVFSCSTVPLRIGLYLGFICAFISLFIFADVLYAKYFTQDAAPGWATSVSIMLFFGGMQLIVLGFIGEYIARIYQEVKGRPLYLVAEDMPRLRHHEAGSRVTASATEADVWSLQGTQLSYDPGQADQDAERVVLP